jgi:serpin B
LKIAKLALIYRVPVSCPLGHNKPPGDRLLLDGNALRKKAQKEEGRSPWPTREVSARAGRSQTSALQVARFVIDLRKDKTIKKRWNLIARYLMLPVFMSYTSVHTNAASDSKHIVECNTAFACGLYQKLRDSENNIFFSPFSISTALAMTYAGARGDTESQMAKTMGFSINQDVHPAFAELASRLTELQEVLNIKLSVANSLWPQKKYPFLENYLSLIKKYYGVSITPVNYIGETEAARKTINEWVEKKTQEKIKNLIQLGILDELTHLVIVNAIYFKGNWGNQFDASKTQDAPFHITADLTVQVPMMMQKHAFRYASQDSLSIIELPYIGNEIAMIILLPKETTGLKQIENDLSVENLKLWESRLNKENVLVFLPKIKMTSTFRLDKELVSMGMVDAFSDERANFAGMDGRPDWLYIKAVLHKAFVEVNEEGTEAAAATAVVVNGRGISTPPPTFRADHPFLFLIKEKQTGSILFMGRMTDPTKSGE